MKVLRQIGGYVVWSLLAASVPVLLYLMMSSNPRLDGLRVAITRSLTYSLMIGVPLTLALNRIAPLMYSWPKAAMIAGYAVVLTSFAVGGTAAGSVVIVLVEGSPWARYAAIFRGGLPWSLLLTFGFGISGLLWGTMQARLEGMNRELRQKKFDEQQARLASLESRVHPHFLFNAINSILSLIREDPRRAEHLLERMAALLRASLDQDQRSLVPLEQELKLAKDYLEIEQARFGSRLRFRFEGAEPGEGVDVPPFSIQTLVENSVKYAITPARAGGEIAVVVRTAEQGLVIEVHDDGPGFTREALAPGHGLELLQGRLTALFEGRAALEFERPAAGMIVRLRIPALVAKA
ncbi:MAG: histidine kinase [Bryobacteraceae bacterium]|nr:histidine kinase [Bryobacteraceae bacterium]